MSSEGSTANITVRYNPSPLGEWYYSVIIAGDNTSLTSDGYEDTQDKAERAAKKVAKQYKDTMAATPPTSVSYVIDLDTMEVVGDPVPTINPVSTVPDIIPTEFNDSSPAQPAEPVLPAATKKVAKK